MTEDEGWRGQRIDMSQELVSIVVPAYNAEAFLRENVEAIISQSYENLEIIYVCDGCTDHTEEILREYAEKDARMIVHVETENHGAAVSRNIGMEKASGEWIIFLDADDLFHCCMIEDMLKAAIKERADVVCCYWEYFEEVPTGEARIMNEMRKLYCDTYPVVDTRKELHQTMLLVDNSPGTKFVHRSIYKKKEVFFQDIPNSNDVYYSMLVVMNSHKIVYVDKPFYCVRSGKGRTTISTNRDIKKSYILEAFSQVYGYIMDREDKLLLLRGFYNTILNNFRDYLDLPVYHVLFNSLRNVYFVKWGMAKGEALKELNYMNRVFYQNILAGNETIDRQDWYMQAKVEFVRELSKKGCSIWGAGAMGRELLKELAKAGIKMQHVFDSAQDLRGKSIHGYVVENFNDIQVDHMIITTPKFYDEIAGMIKNRVKNIYNLEQEIWRIPHGGVSAGGAYRI